MGAYLSFAYNGEGVEVRYEFGLVALSCSFVVRFDIHTLTPAHHPHLHRAQAR